MSEIALNMPLTQPSQIKFKQFPIDFNNAQYTNNFLSDLLDAMFAAYMVEPKIEFSKPASKKSMVKLFSEFSGPGNTKFSNDLKKMDTIYSFKLNGATTLNFILNRTDESKRLVSAIIHAVHTFCHLFPYDYHGLVINICLDDNKRDLIIPETLKNDAEKFKYLEKHALAFNVSGMTNRMDKLIDVTRSEEMIKLLYHEMVHYIGLDTVLLDHNIDSTLSIKNKLNLSEAYTEFMSIILKSAYQSIYLAGLNKWNLADTFAKILYLEIQYSFYLCSNILAFYGYNKDTYNQFFQGISDKKYSPIPIWEYVFLRAALLMNINQVVDIVALTHWHVTSSTSRAVIELMIPTNKFIDKLSFFIIRTKPIQNISYSMIDLIY